LVNLLPRDAQSLQTLPNFGLTFHIFHCVRFVALQDVILLRVEGMFGSFSVDNALTRLLVLRNSLAVAVSYFTDLISCHEGFALVKS
jgi:hypothetical protein